MKRQIDSKYILILEKNKKLSVPQRPFLAKLGAEGIIRIEHTQYKHLPSGKFLAHFNLERCGHHVGKIYALPRILKHGYFNTVKNEEQLPLLSFKGIYFFKCIEVRQQLRYSELRKKDFKFSFSNIKNVAQLKKSILGRYSKSMPELSEDEIINLGVSYTLLEKI